MEMKTKNGLQQNETIQLPSVRRMMENILGCKWSLTVFDLIAQGINRPGEMVRNVEGLTTKVLNERLRKLVRFGIVARTSYPEIPPRVEYSFTEFGTQFLHILKEIEKLENMRQRSTRN